MSPVYGPPLPPPASQWQETTPDEEADFGVQYRTSVVCAAWAFPLVDPGRIQVAVEVGSLIAGGHVRVKHLEIFAPGGVPEEWVQRGYKKSDWGVQVTWEKAAAGTPVLVLAAAIVAVIVAATLAWVVIAKFTEKELHQTLEDTKDLLQQTIFSPGVIIAALAAIALTFHRR